MNELIKYVSEECENYAREISVKEKELEDLKNKKVEAESVLALHKETEHAIKNEDMYTQLQRVYNVSTDVADATRIEENKSSLKLYSSRLDNQLSKYNEYDASKHKIDEAKTCISTSLNSAKSVLPEIEIVGKIMDTPVILEKENNELNVNPELEVVKTEEVENHLTNTVINVDSLPNVEQEEHVDDIFANLDNPFTALYDENKEENVDTKNVDQQVESKDEPEITNEKSEESIESSNPFAKMFQDINQTAEVKEESHEDNISLDQYKLDAELQNASNETIVEEKVEDSHPNKVKVVNMEPAIFNSYENEGKSRSLSAA